MIVAEYPIFQIITAQQLFKPDKGMMGIESESYWEESVPNYSNCDYCPPLLLSLLLFPLEGNDLADRKKEGSATRSDDDKCRFRLTSQTICRCACARLYCVSALSREVALRLAVSGLKRWQLCLSVWGMNGGRIALSDRRRRDKDITLQHAERWSLRRNLMFHH